MTKAKIRNSPEAKRWLIVGAYQAGATEKHVARISGLSRTAVRNIILNYQRTGTPCIPKKIPKKIRQKLVVEYDENGNIINTDDEGEGEEEVDVQEVEAEARIASTNSTRRSSGSSMIKKKIVKRKPRTTATANVTTKDIINYAMDQMRITDNNHINSSTQRLIEKEQQQTQYHHPYSQAVEVGETSNSSSDSINSIASTTNSSSIYIPTTTNPSSSWHNLLSPPHQQLYYTSNPNPNTNNTKQKKERLPPPSKFDQNIRGYELWTHDDDMILLNHVLHHLHGGGWNELEIRFNGRHSARLCYDRWKHLKSLLLKGITDKPNTPW